MMDTRFSKLDETDYIMAKVNKQIYEMETRMRKEHHDMKDIIEKQFKALIEDNLQVPGLIGDKEYFKNLRGWLSYMNTHVDK